MPKSLGVDTFPDPIRHFGAPWRPFWILQAVRRCRRWASSPFAARLVFQSCLLIWPNYSASCALYVSARFRGGGGAYFLLSFFMGCISAAMPPSLGVFTTFSLKNVGIDPFPGPINHFRFCKHCHMGSRVPPAPQGWYSQRGTSQCFLNPSTPLSFICSIDNNSGSCIFYCLLLSSVNEVHETS